MMRSGGRAVMQQRRRWQFPSALGVVVASAAFSARSVASHTGPLTAGNRAAAGPPLSSIDSVCLGRRAHTTLIAALIESRNVLRAKVFTRET